MTARMRPPEPADVGSPVRGTMIACRSIALASALLLGGTLQLAAQTPDPPDPPDPAAGFVWGGCVLNDLAAAALPDVDFVVVYTLENPDDGQALGNDQFTGPVICINEDRVGITAFEAGGTTLLTPESQIPGATDPGGATTVDLLGAEEALILQYGLPPGALNTIEKRFCQTHAGSSRCFIIGGS